MAYEPSPEPAANPRSCHEESAESGAASGGACPSDALYTGWLGAGWNIAARTNDSQIFGAIKWVCKAEEGYADRPGGWKGTGLFNTLFFHENTIIIHFGHRLSFDLH
jgi:hypothetical protein